MSLFVIGDLHLSLAADKPMDVFGGAWVGYVDKLREGFAAVGEEDTVVMPGDLSWAMSLESTKADFDFINELPGRKIFLKGNHDYWWTTAAKMRRFFEENGWNFELLHNNSLSYENYALCGTRGWYFADVFGDAGDEKVYKRELIRLDTSLKSAKDGGFEHIIAFLHYPPIVGSKACDDITRMLDEYGVERCYYGHLHGGAHSLAFEGVYGGVDYRLISADYLNFKPLKIL